MKTTIGLLVLFFAVLGGGYALYAHNQAAAVDAVSETPAPEAISTTTETTSATPAATSGTTAQPGTYTSAQISTHNNVSSCWTSINGGVYDLTKWIAQHPGGKAPILSICGKDGTKMFEGQHSGDSQPQQMLATFKIGTLAS